MVTIRRFKTTDGLAVGKLISHIMSGEFQEAQSAYPTDDIERIGSAYGGLGEAFFVAVIDSKVVGTVAVKKEDNRVALLRRLFVDSTYRKRRIGLKLLNRALQFCDKMGYQEIIFRTTSYMRSANQICQKRGFVQRAKLKMGPIELLKFSLSLRNSLKKAKSS